ncbi:MAG TPA: agmatine deiminase family protein [Flavobacteriaceae bacterium]|nr:agmatine deiminase family protein [Flavobacteriaceae bacterium]MCB9214128.1 agmatine deiminase family protein [Alteromonas sp.]HPF11531.1 agmatine deiminase family protein [Flavobacteriaceae bacterium]HQU21064.1 agmatine deiminase family protein [Flavobacteriaceae bacterium]HQU65216.1 agmatine deiminase family protein [Flavobacteriaceae bacterium]
MKLFRTSLLYLVLLALSFSVSAQEVLPRNLTKTEEGLVSSFKFRSNRMTDPPAGPVRTMAEWEEIEYLVITWEPNFENILSQIVAAAVQECKVIITTHNETSVANFLTGNGVSLANVTFMDENWDSIWIRDYGAQTIYSDDVGERALIDWIYNRPRPNDDVMPSAHASLVGMPIYITDSGTNDLVNTGGNFMCDGMGTAFASNLILNENAAGNPYGVSPKTEEEIDDIMNAYMGLDRYIKMQTLPYDVIHHIDMHMKLLDEETLLVSQYPAGVADGPQIEANIEYVLNNFMSPFGTPYKVEWIPAPPSTSGAYPDTGGSYRTYTNSVFVNRTILVPTYRPEVDTPALAQYQELLPGYNVVGIDVDNPGENIIALLGAIHCITNAIGVEDPLWIVHQPIAEANVSSTVTVDAMIKHNSGISTASVFWREAGTTTYTEVPMSFVSDDNWTADLTMPSVAGEVEYYIAAEANSGKTMTRPIVAPEGYWTIQVGSLSIEDWAEQQLQGPYPNPTRGAVHFNLNQIPGPIKVRIHNLLGQQLYETTLDQGNGQLDLNLNADWRGTLLVTFEGDFGKIHRKVIKL